MTRWELWLAGCGASALLLSALYLVQRRTRDATAADAGWGAALYATLAPGELSQRLLIAVPSVFVPWFPGRSSTA